MINKFLVFLFLAPLSVYAQTIDSRSFKPAAGEKTLELQFAPLGNNPISISGIRARWFSSETKAFRLNTFIGIDADTEIIQQEDTDLGLEELKSSSMELAISIRPGFEKHLLVSEKLSPFFGMEFDLAFQNTSQKVEQQSGADVDYLRTINANRTGFVRLGANALAGLDYYIAEKLYLGTEFGFGLSYTRFLPSKVKSDIAGFIEPDPENQGNAFDLGPNVLAQIRLGYAF